MGIRFSTNTWRAPLQLIDCWLPHNQSAEIPPTKPAPRLLQRFVKAGWLHRPSPASAAANAASFHPASSPARHSANERVVEAKRQRNNSKMINNARLDGRFVLSGRIDQVCDELERLAALEQRIFQ